MARTVFTPVRASGRCQNRNMIQAVEQVEGRKGKSRRGRCSFVSRNAEVKKFIKKFCHASKRDPCDDPVCAGRCDRMLFTETCVNTAEEDRSPGINLTRHGDHLFYPGIPIGHQRSHENRIRPLGFLQGVHKELFWNPVSAIRSWNMLEGLWSESFFPEELTGSIITASQWSTVCQRRMMNIQTVDQVDVESASSEIPCQIKKTKGL